jgi:uncharacterized membrane protein
VPVSFSLAHYVYMPGMVLLDIPLRLLGLSFAWAAIPGLVLLGAAAVALGRSEFERTASVLALVLSPVFLFDYLYLFNDLFFLAPAIGSFALLRRRRALTAGILFGLALAIKQTALLLAPFLVIAALRELDGRRRWHAAAGVVAAVSLVTLPFLAWNPAAFLADTAAFFYGSGVDSYPIRGVGLSGLLLQTGFIPSRWSPYPAAVLQAVVVLPLLALATLQFRRAAPGRFWQLLWAWLGVEVIAIFFLGRALAPNYLDIGAGFLVLALALTLEHGSPAPARVVRGIDTAPSH